MIRQMHPGKLPPRLMHAAALDACAVRKRTPDGAAYFGGKAIMRRKTRKLVSRATIRRAQ